MTRPLDTSEEGHRFQAEGYRRMTPERKIELMLELSETMRVVASGSATPASG